MDNKVEIPPPSAYRNRKNKSGLFDFMPCYKGNEYDFELKNQSSVLTHPTSIIDIEPPSTKKYNCVLLDAAFGNSSWNFAKPNPLNTNPNRLFFNREDYPIGEVFLLGQKYKIVAKVAYKQIQKPLEDWNELSVSLLKKSANQNRLSTAKPPKKDSIFRSIRKTLFSKKTREPIVEFVTESTPGYVAEHIARRLKCDIIIDALCGFGGNTIEFAKQCNFVIAIDSHINKIASVKRAADKQNLGYRIDFLPMDFMKIKKLTGDIVFLDPSDTRTNPREPYSIFKHSQPDITDLLAKSFEICSCIAVKLPHNTDLTEVPYLFHKSLEKNCQHSKRFCIEIEKVYNSQNEPECIMIYFGDINSISVKEEYQAIYNFIFDNDVTEAKNKISLEVAATIIEKIGLQKSIKFLTEIEEIFSLEDSARKVSRCDAFLSKIVHKNLISSHFLKNLIEEGSELPSDAVFNQTTPSSLAIIKKNSDLYNDNSQANSIMDNIVNKKTFKGLSTMRGKSNSDRDLPLIHEVNRKASDKLEATKLEKIEPSKYSYEISELAVSSYSVSSSYLQGGSLDDEGTSHAMKASINNKLSINKRLGKNKPETHADEEADNAPIYFSITSLRDEESFNAKDLIDADEPGLGDNLEGSKEDENNINNADSLKMNGETFFSKIRSSVRKETLDDYEERDRDHQASIKKALF